MIRINLLPVREIQKREKLKQQVLLYFLVIGVAVVLMALGHLHFKGNIGELETTEKYWKDEKKKYGNIARELREVRTDKELLQEKIDVITRLEKERKGPVKVLDEFSVAMPAQKAWLLQLSQKSSNISIDGIALNDPTITQFVDALRSSDILTNVELQESKEKVINNRRLMNFAVVCNVDLNKLKGSVDIEEEVGKVDKKAGGKK